MDNGFIRKKENALAKSAVRSLFEKGVVDTDKVDTYAAYLTPEGYALAQKK